MRGIGLLGWAIRNMTLIDWGLHTAFLTLIFVPLYFIKHRGEF